MSLLPSLSAMVAATAYCLAMFGRSPDHWPAFLRGAVGGLGRWVAHRLWEVYAALGVSGATQELIGGTFLVLSAGLVPWLVMLLLRRGRPYDLGIRRPNRIGWRILLVGYLLTLPLVIWMAGGARFAGMYLPRLERVGLSAFLAYYLAVFLPEHLLFQGIMLAAFRRNRRWPAPAPVARTATTPLGRCLQWIGLAQTVGTSRGLSRLTRWIGLPEGCLLAVVVSGLLFGLVHVGKDAREFLLSFPGGLGLAYVAYRTNTWLVPFALHAATAATALLVIAMVAD